MTIDEEIERIIQRGATPIFLIGLVRLAATGNNADLLCAAITRIGRKLYEQAETKADTG